MNTDVRKGLGYLVAAFAVAIVAWIVIATGSTFTNRDHETVGNVLVIVGGVVAFATALVFMAGLFRIARGLLRG